MSNLSDEHLVADCLNGNPKAFESLLDRYQKKLFNTALRMLKNTEDAQDVTQTVFIKAYERLETFDPKYKFFSWIYRIMMNETVNCLNLRNKSQALPEGGLTSLDTPASLLDNKELTESIQDALMALKVDYRMAVVFRHFADLSYEEMAFVLDIPEKTVKSRLFTARRQLGHILSKRGVTN
jgi:RNA polymerase sigma-70 factor (ECF subfamily)